MNYSNEYATLLTQLHATESEWGTSGHTHAEEIEKLRPMTLLDYGCGKGTLIKELKQIMPDTPMEGYDPFIPEFSTLQVKPYDVVTCTDVLEHIEPEYLQDVLREISNCTYRVAYLVVALTPARQILPDGRNAHLIVQPVNWWHGQISRHFKRIAVPTITKNEAIFICLKH